MAGSNFPLCLEVKGIKGRYSGCLGACVCVFAFVPDGLFVFLYGFSYVGLSVCACVCKWAC